MSNFKAGLSQTGNSNSSNTPSACCGVVYFHYPWAESDDIEIQMPANFSLDNADSPGLISDPQKIGALDINIAVNQTTKTLVYKRKFYFGNDGNILFPVRAYQPLKNMFDAFSKADAHTITLKQN